MCSFHVDHAAGLPYITEKVSLAVSPKTAPEGNDSRSQTNFRDGPGKVYMTHATKAIYGLTMMDTVRIQSVKSHSVYLSTTNR